MLQVELDVPDFDIEQFIKQCCSRLGRVTSVKIHRSPCPFALIGMARREQARELTSRFGGSAFGTCALIHLEPVTNRQSRRSRGTA
jgi:hypothetical protein